MPRSVRSPHFTFWCLMWTLQLKLWALYLDNFMQHTVAALWIDWKIAWMSKCPVRVYKSTHIFSLLNIPYTLYTTLNFLQIDLDQTKIVSYGNTISTQWLLWFNHVIKWSLNLRLNIFQLHHLLAYYINWLVTRFKSKLIDFWVIITFTVLHLFNMLVYQK